MSLSLEDNRACLEESKARLAESLITLTEAVTETSQSRDKMLRLASKGEIDLYCQFGEEKIACGTLAIAPAQENPIEWLANCKKNYAQALPPVAEMHLINPDNFLPDGFDFPENEIIRLLPRQIRALLANKKITLKYGWLSTGAAFKVIEPAEGMQIGRDGLLISTNTNWFKKNKRQQQISDLGQSRQQVEVKRFHIPSGTEWYDIRIHFVDTKNVKITIGKGKTCERNYKSLGFANKKTKEWKKGWMHLFLMAVRRGKPPNVKDVDDITSKHVSDLGKELKFLFPGIDGNPFKGYLKELGWEPRITLSCSPKIEEQYRHLI